MYIKNKLGIYVYPYKVTHIDNIYIYIYISVNSLSYVNGFINCIVKSRVVNWNKFGIELSNNKKYK